jgi:hypothetical protein
VALAALIVSVISACAAIAAIIVTLKIHNEQGSKLECRWSNAYPVYGATMGEHHISVAAVNCGRAATTIGAWGFAIFGRDGRDTDATLVDTNPPAWQPSLPQRVESESSATWLMSAASIAASLAATRYADGVLWAFVTTGSGRRVLSATPVPTPTGDEDEEE